MCSLIIQSNWREIVKAINGIYGFGGLNTGEALGMKYGGDMKGPQEWDGVAFWFAGNSRIFVNAMEENVSLIELRTDDEQADEKAINTFEKLRLLLKPAYQAERVQAENEPTDKPPRLPKGKRLNEWKSIWRRVKGAWHGGGHTYKVLTELFPKTNRPSEKLMAEILRAAEYYKWD